MTFSGEFYHLCTAAFDPARR